MVPKLCLESMEQAVTAMLFTSRPSHRAGRRLLWSAVTDSHWACISPSLYTQFTFSVFYFHPPFPASPSIIIFLNASIHLQDFGECVQHGVGKRQQYCVLHVLRLVSASIAPLPHNRVFKNGLFLWVHWCPLYVCTEWVFIAVRPCMCAPKVTKWVFIPPLHYHSSGAKACGSFSLHLQSPDSPDRAGLRRKKCRIYLGCI